MGALHQSPVWCDRGSAGKRVYCQSSTRERHSGLCGMRDTTKKTENADSSEKRTAGEASSNRLGDWLGKSPFKWIAWIGQAVPIFGARVVFSFLLGAALSAAGLWTYTWIWDLPFAPPISEPRRVNWDVKADFVRAPIPGGLPSKLSPEQKQQLTGSAVRLFPTSIVKWPNIDDNGELSFIYSVPHGKNIEDKISKIELLNNKNWVGELIFKRENNNIDYRGGMKDNSRSGPGMSYYYIELVPRK